MRTITRSLSLLLAVLLLAAAVIPTGALRIKSDEAAADESGIVWEFDFDAMKDGTDAMGSTEYSFDGTSAAVKDFATLDGEKCMFFNHTVCKINDLANALVNQDTFYVDYKVYFEEFPTGERDGETADEYPLSIFTWVPDKNYDRGIRVDSQGNLFRTRYTSSAIGVQLEKEKWYNLRFALSPKTGAFEIYVDNELVLSDTCAKIEKTSSSIVRFFDTAYTYKAYIKDISVLSLDGYKIRAGGNTEKSAEYLGIQTTPVKDGKFSLRAVAAVDTLDYNAAGIRILAVGNGEAEYDREAYGSTVYESFLAGGKTVTAESLGAKYLVLYDFGEINAETAPLEIVVRPFIRKNGYRAYGESISLMYDGKEKGGYPVITKLTVDESAPTELIASGDTFVHAAHASDNYGTVSELELKNNGGKSNTRNVYVKFDIPDSFAKTLADSAEINFKIKFKSCRAASESETAAGGVLANLYAVGADWDENELTFSNAAAKAPQIKQVSSTRYLGAGYISFDVTDYVKSVLDEGWSSLAFRIENAVNDSSSSQGLFFSREDSDEQAPVLSIASEGGFGHSFGVSKSANAGYEPWGFAEKIVDDWIEWECDEVYGRPVEEDIFKVPDVDIKKKSGTHTLLVPTKGGNPVTATSYTNTYARTIDTLISDGGYKEETVSEYDEYGGITNAGFAGKATGFFHIENFGERDFIIDPLGNPFIAVGFNTVNAGSNDHQKQAALKKYGTTEAVYEAITARFHELGINTALSGSVDAVMATSTPVATTYRLSGISSYMGSLGLSVSTGGSSAFAYNNTMNVFDPDFIGFVFERNVPTFEKYRDNPLLLGYISDNEIPKDKDMLNRYLTLDPTVAYNAFSYAAAWTWFCARTGKVNPTLNDVTDELQKEFIGFVYNRLFKIVNTAIRTNDPNHMYLGTKADGNNKTNVGYLLTAGYYCEALTINMYDGIEPNHSTLQTIRKYSGKPFIVTEFYAKAEDAYDMNGQLLANQQNAGCQVKTQQDRADYLQNYTLLMLESKYCLGWMWYKFQDNDQSLYTNDGGKTILRVFKKGTGYAIDSFLDQNGNVVTATGKETQIYKGETDTSNLGSNKGIVDDFMNEYPLLAASFKRVNDNLFGLIEYFDNLHK